MYAVQNSKIVRFCSINFWNTSVECLDEDEVSWVDGDVVVYLDEGVLVCLDNNNEDDFDVDFILAYLLE